MRKKKRRVLAMSLTVFMMVSLLSTSVVHATGVENIVAETREETSIDTNDLETGSENESVEVMSDEACLEETNDLGNAENPASDENIISVESENLNEEIAEDLESEADLLVEESDSVPTESIWVGENLQVDHKIVNYWNEGYQGEIIITNLNEKTIEDWNLMFEMDINITQIWNASIKSYENNKYIIANNDWNANINAGESVSLGYTATYEGAIAFPEYYGLTGIQEEVAVDEYEIVYEIVDVWEDGYVANLTICNLSSTDLRNWKISFDLQDSICDLWNGKINTNENEHYVIHCENYNAVIKSGESVTIGFRVQGDDLQMYPENYAVKVIVHSTMRTDMRDDVIGIAYFEDLKAEDYRIESDGIQYVANQLNLVGKDGVTFEQIAQLGEEYEFEIVGYIEFTNDYQIKFVNDKTYEDLNALMREMGQNKLILEANLNLVSSIESEIDIDIPNDEKWADENLWIGEVRETNWGLRAINVLEAWQYEEYMTTVKVGIYDNMFDEEHEDLNFVKVWNNCTPMDEDWDDHGTHVAGTMAAEYNNGEGSSGVAIKTELFGYACEPVKDEVSGEIKTTSMEYKYAFALMIGNGVRVINISYSTGREEGFAASQGNEAAKTYIHANAGVMDNFLQRLVARGYDFVLVIAAGNTNGYTFIKDDAEDYGYRYYDATIDDSADKEVGGALAIYNHFLSYSYQSSDRIIVVGAFGEIDADNDIYQYATYSCIGDRVDITAPGNRIYSTVSGDRYQNTYYDGEGIERDWSGTSMAAPHVSGVAALAYSVNPELSGVQVKDIVTGQCSDYIVKDLYNNSYHCLDAELVVREALERTGHTPILGENTGFILGKVCSAQNGKDIVAAQVCAYKYSSYDGNIGLGSVSDYQYVTSTDSNGEFSLELDPGMYQIKIYYSAYKPLIIDNVKVTENSTEYLEEVMYLDFSILGSATLKGTLVDAINGKAVEGAEITVRSGWNNYSGNIVKGQVFTDANGEYDVNLPIGYYTIEFKKEGYINSYVNVVVYHSAESQMAVICPQLEENEVRVVLTWGNTPNDLDSHLRMYESDSIYQHIYFGNRQYYDSYNDRMYTLDVDDVTQYGPETITFYTDNPRFNEYKYYIYNYSGGGAGNELSFSGARVTIYYGNQESRTINVPVNEMGRTWNVFRVVDGNIIIENTITSY